MTARLLRPLQLVSTYLPLAGTVVLLLITTFDSGLLKSISPSLLLAIMAVSFLFVAVHLETRLAELNATIVTLGGALTSRVAALETTQKEYLQATVSPLRTATLGEVFQLALRNRGHVGHLRVYAISSQQILGFVRNHSFHIDRCSLLVRWFSADDRSDFAAQVRLVLDDWAKLHRAGRIGELDISFYDFFPSEYEVIFDTTALILGLYDLDPEDYSGVKVRDATLIEGGPPSAQQIIHEFCDRFDGLHAACKSSERAS
jgi:hypothetical protein